MVFDKFVSGSFNAMDYLGDKLLDYLMQRFILNIFFEKIGNNMNN